MALYKLQNLSFYYAGSSKAALQHIELTVEKGHFILLCGTSGSGKSTLLRQLKKEICPEGRKEGTVLYKNQAINSLADKQSVSEIGMVFQNPDHQIVMSTVWQELTFAMENLGFNYKEIQRRVAEVATFFGIDAWLSKETKTLSGGQKQLLSLASVMVLRPEVLLLDEPTAQLDPIATREFFSMLRQLHKELSMTIILSEHRLDEVFSLVDEVWMMNQGSVSYKGKPKQVIDTIWKGKSTILQTYLPQVSKLYLQTMETYNIEDIPVTVNEAKQWFDKRYIEAMKALSLEKQSEKQSEKETEKETVITCKDIYFQYKKEDPFILKQVTFELKKGDFLTLLGGNGSGKSTLLKVLAGILKPQRGKVLTHKKIGYLAQNPMIYFNKETVGEQLESILEEEKIKEKTKILKEIIEFLEIKTILDQHPYDISGGQQQKVALAMVLLKEPDILLMDEPTKGLDPYWKGQFAQYLKDLIKKHKTIIMVSHDMEFVAQYAEHTTLMFNGNILSLESTQDFFRYNHFYTTLINRTVKERLPWATTLKDVVALCKEEL